MEVGFQFFTQLRMSDKPGGIFFGRNDTFLRSGYSEECLFDTVQIGFGEIVMVAECQRVYVTGMP